MVEKEHDQLVSQFPALLKDKEDQHKVDIDSSDTKEIKD